MKKEKPKQVELTPFRVKLEGTLPDGRKIAPETLSIEKFAQLFGRFHRLVEVALEDDKDTLKQVNFRYERGSACAISDLPPQAHQIIQEEVRQIEAGHPINLSVSGIAGALLELKQIAESVGEGAKISVGTEKETYIEITKETHFEQLKNILIDTESIVYGKLYSVGGKSPNIHLSLNDQGASIIIRVSEEQARELAKYLYSEVGVRVSLKQNMLTREITSAHYIAMLPYSRVLNEEKFAQDKEVGTRVWAGIDPVEWEKEHRGGNT